MKNLLNCHSVGLHSFPISFENGLYRRVFYAEHYHSMWKPFEVAIHPHHVDIKITVLSGSLYNPLYEINNDGKVFNKFKWDSHILNGNGGFEKLGIELLKEISCKRYDAGDIITMKACELHTIEITKACECVWLVEETIPTCEYFPINYSPHDLTEWTPEGLYIEVDDTVKQKYIGEYLKQIK